MGCLVCCAQAERPPPKKSPRGSLITQNKRGSLYRGASVYHIEEAGEGDLEDIRQRNAHQLRLQLLLTEELSSETYGLKVAKKGCEQYEAQDFFTFKEILGSGSTAVVFRAVFKPTGRMLAVKFIPNFRTVKLVVMRELKVLKLSNECRFLIDFHSHFRVGNNLYFVMEMCEGGSLEDLIQPSYHLPAKMMKIYLKEISSALFFLHAQKLVHRDVAPPNILIDGKGHLKLGDFGLCRIVDDPQGEIMTDCGKPYIKAPELYMDKPCSFAMDWWSVGIIVYRFITGYFPFKTEKLTQGYQSVTKHQEKYPEWAFVDNNAKTLCQGLLVKRPKERLASENEEYVIKNHPYFEDVNWECEEDVIEVARSLLETAEDSGCSTVAQRLLTTLGRDGGATPQTPQVKPYPPGPSGLHSLLTKVKATGNTAPHLFSLFPRGDGLTESKTPEEALTPALETTV